MGSIVALDTLIGRRVHIEPIGTARAVEGRIAIDTVVNVTMLDTVASGTIQVVSNRTGCTVVAVVGGTSVTVGHLASEAGLSGLQNSLTVGVNASLTGAIGVASLARSIAAVTSAGLGERVSQGTDQTGIVGRAVLAVIDGTEHTLSVLGMHPIRANRTVVRLGAFEAAVHFATDTGRTIEIN